MFQNQILQVIYNLFCLEASYKPAKDITSRIIHLIKVQLDKEISLWFNYVRKNTTWITYAKQIGMLGKAEVT